MIPGLNSNIKHEERMFHIQTEDSGPKYGHVISHLFHEGVILATVKKSYKDKLETYESDELTELVKKLMRASHRQMVRKLISGDFNEAAGIEVAVAPEADSGQQLDVADDAVEKAERQSRTDLNAHDAAGGAEGSEQTDATAEDRMDVDEDFDDDDADEESVDLDEDRDGSAQSAAENEVEAIEISDEIESEPGLPSVDAIAERLNLAAKPVADAQNAHDLMQALLNSEA